jgi:drug/metabolite transporter (DMT)-like permease
MLWAISTHLDKYLVEKYFKHSSVAVLLIFTALIGLLALPFIWFLGPDVMALGPRSAALTALAGVLYMGGLLFYLWALQFEEASVVAPFYQATPLFGYALGYFVLGETLSNTQLIGGALVIGGALLVSLNIGAHALKLNVRLVALMLTCALSMAVSSLIFKIFALQDEFWPTTFWMYAGEAAFGGAMLTVASHRRQFMALLRSSPCAVLSINAANELINLGGGLGARYALVLAPLSLVQAISSTTTLFVFGTGLLLTNFFPVLSRETASARELVRNGFAAVFVALGAYLVGR